jgi:2-iminobutanoate/2-iminopropanoate deaminase
VSSFTFERKIMKKVISSPDAPAAIGPYSQAIEIGNLVFCSGQIPLDPKTGDVVAGDIQAHTEQVLKNIQAVLKAADLQLTNVVKTTIFLTDMKDFPKVNEVYGKYFPNNPPARSTVGVAALPKGVNVEIEVLASRG